VIIITTLVLFVFITLTVILRIILILVLIVSNISINIFINLIVIVVIFKSIHRFLYYFNQLSFLAITLIFLNSLKFIQFLYSLIITSIEFFLYHLNASIKVFIVLNYYLSSFFQFIFLNIVFRLLNRYFLLVIYPILNLQISFVFNDQFIAI